MEKPVDYKLFFVILALVIFGMIMISSVSVYSSFNVTNKMVWLWKLTEAYNYFYVLRNIWHVFTSLLLLWIVAKVSFHFFEKYSKHIFIWTLSLLCIVLIMWFSLKWAKWWIILPFLPSIQPAEILKISLILYLSYFFKKYKSTLHTLENWFLPFMMIIWITFFLVALQPDFWTIMVLLPVSMIMFFLWWWNLKHIIVLASLWILLFLSVYSLWKYDKTVPWSRNKLSYITDRIDNFLSDNKTAIKNKTINYQTEQGLIAIWSGWFTWLWFWKSIQKFWYLPEVQWDFIFAVIVEELWLLWAFILLSIYMYIWYRWFYISTKVNDIFAKNVAIWISSWILIQAFINVWVNLNILPLTWITLPFVSYGWSSLITLMFGIWILLNISRHVEERPKYERLERKRSLFWDRTPHHIKTDILPTIIKDEKLDY
jgi:cell division protein FtsW